MRFQYRTLLLSTLLLFAAREGNSTCEKNMKAVEPGRKCRKSCSQDTDCHSPNKRCQCDGACGMSCIGSASECDEPEAPINGVVYRSSVRWKGIALYICTNGYDMIGKNTRICRSDRAWGGVVPSCERAKCQQLQNIKHGVRVPMKTFLYEDSYEYSCMEGWRISGNARLVCRFDGSWSSSTPTCQQIKCAHPDSMNGRVILPEKYIWLPSDEATVLCKESYEISEQRNVTCGANGEWSAQFPTCSHITCPSPTIRTNQVLLSVQSIWHVNDEAVYTCGIGYRISSGYTTLQCQNNGEWSKNAPYCSRVRCYVSPIENADFDIRRYYYRDVRTITCRRGYRRQGQGRVTCQWNGRWGILPTCEKIQCKHRWCN